MPEGGSKRLFTNMLNHGCPIAGSERTGECPSPLTSYPADLAEIDRAGFVGGTSLINVMTGRTGPCACAVDMRSKL